MLNETKTLTFYGSSDDNFCYDVDGRGTDEIGCYEKRATFALCTIEGVALMYVHGEYLLKGPGAGTWLVGVSLVEEDVALPAWPVAIRTNNNLYSPSLDITVPKHIKVRNLAEEEGVS